MSVFITAEIGINANNNLFKAMNLIDKAIYAGANAVKFQHWSDDYYNKCEWRDKLDGQRWSEQDLITLKKYTEGVSKKENRKVEWFCTAFDMKSFELIDRLGVNIYKIPANKYVWFDRKFMNDIIDIAKRKRKQKRLFVSYDGDFGPIYFYDRLQYERIWPTIFYCGRIKEYSISTMLDFFCTYRDEYVDIQVGLSDHSSKIEIPIAAVVLGAQAIEVHLTLDKDDIGPDHKMSLNFEEFYQMVKMIRNIERIR